MLPLQQAIEVRRSILEYVKATYAFKDTKVNDAFYRFVENERSGLFKGPYISLKTPFVAAEENDVVPLEIAPSFKPHWHQLQAFEWLKTLNGHTPVPTLLTTGTGSGKTECFLFPILDYCYQCNKVVHQPGVKVIIMYPMNALASDQAKRIAEAINGDTRLNGKVTAGLFIGEGEHDEAFPTTMGADHIIEDRSAIVDTVPDILLTNFKMLDYGLMQQRYMPLWKGNIGEENPALKFIVLDELHTYDGAQGTDVANLIRRLKLKLGLKQGHLCPVGTSATIGNGTDSKKQLCEYAESVFGEHFEEDNVIEEHRVPVDQFFNSVTNTDVPSEYDLGQCKFLPEDTTDSYLKRLRRIWLPTVVDNPIEIGKELRKLAIVRDLLKVTSVGISSLEDVIDNLARENRDVSRLRRMDEEYAQIVVESLLALISVAKVDVDGRLLPFLQLQVQLWVRELSGILRYVQKEPQFTWKGKIIPNHGAALSMYYCRECGASGWLSRRGATDHGYGLDISRNNSDFMSHKPEVMLLNTLTSSHRPIPEYLLGSGHSEQVAVDPITLKEMDEGAKGSLTLLVCNKRTARDNGKESFFRMCPECGAESLSIVGTRNATLSSVAMSQVFSSDFDSSEPKDRKILTFTNSVQDAAFQAGFYEARTYNFLFRQSLQQYLNTLERAVPLTELQRGFKAYWKAQLPGEEYYYRFLSTDLIGEVDLKHNYRENGDYTPKFKEEFDLRVDWDICAEFGLNAQVGRTLEKTGASATYFAKEDLEKAWERFKAWIQENKLIIDKDEFIGFANSILHRMRIRGAVDHPYLDWFRSGNLKQYELNWGGRNKPSYDGRARDHFLNRCFGGTMKMPKMITTTEHTFNTNGKGKAILDCTFSKSEETWFVKFFYGCFANSLHNALGDKRVAREIINDFYKEFFQVLADCEIVNRKDAGDGNYALNPAKIFVQPKVHHYICKRCNAKLDVAAEDSVSDGSKCLSYGCDGHYELDEDRPDENYYQMVYNRRHSPRIYAREHTGILDRGYREKLEKDFKEHPNFDSINALSATSTLEMGIDIGDLNVAANAEIPPKPSNFMQRVGRAGRKSGTALILNYANQGNEHDLFYFDEPLEMMAGEVSTPGCFLEAKDILRRHFFAYCIDSWISASKDNDLPPKIKLLSLKESSVTSPDFKINVLCTYIENNEETLKSRFKAVYPERSQKVIEELFCGFKDDSFFDRIRQEFSGLVRRMGQLSKARKEIAEAAKGIGDTDPRKDEYVQQVKAIGLQINHILEERTIEFMTEVGLLPNYAFPEKGIELNAYIRSTMAKNDTKQNVGEPTEIDLVRPPASGIKELAPGNMFFSQGHKLPITGIDISTLQDSNPNPHQNTLKRVRFCSRCDSLAEEGTETFNEALCPKCGHGSWGQNVHRFLDYRASVCKTTTKDAVLNDSAEERNKVPFWIKTHFKFNDTATLSYCIKDGGFGIEFNKDVEITTVNYGSRESYQSQVRVSSDGRIPELGFIVCKHCGRATSILTADAKTSDWHYGFCKQKDVVFDPTAINTDVFETTYLYRSFSTEAIKVLLPVQNFESDAMIQMFKAGLALGLREFYKSSPDHLRIEQYAEFNKATDAFDNYLVIYDTIPGGTGYLTKLFTPESFSKVINYAYERIHGCKCADDGHDGCYHCIYTYANKYNHDSLKRSVADMLFAKLKSQLDNWETYNGSLGTVAKSGVVEDSELELKFIKELENRAQQRGWSFKKKIDVDTYHYELVVNGPALELTYVIWPQYKSLKYTVPDFQFICIDAKVNNQEIDAMSIPQWAVFLDGYAYHADKNCFRFYGDVKKRDSIRKDACSVVYPWTIVYDDMFDRVDHKDGSFEDALYKQAIHNQSEDFPNDLSNTKNSFDRFVTMLTKTTIGDIQTQLANYLACWYISPSEMNICRVEDVCTAIAKNASNELSNRVTDSDKENGEFFVKTSLLQETSLVRGSMWYNWNATPCTEDIRYSFKMNENLGEIPLEDWKLFWQCYNLLQFFMEESATAVSGTNTNIDAILESYDSSLEPVIRTLVAKGISVNPDGETAIVDNSGEVIAEADLVVQDKKIAVNLWDEGLKQTVEAMGYKVFTVENFNIENVE